MTYKEKSGQKKQATGGLSLEDPSVGSESQSIVSEARDAAFETGRVSFLARGEASSSEDRKHVENTCSS